MEILTQYYTENGQIIARAPDMAKREFYRDLCTHTFNEMFVAGKEFSGPTYTIVSDCLFCNYGGGSGDEMVISGNSGVRKIPGRDGRDALVTESTTYDGNSVLTGDYSSSFRIIGNASASLIFRTPSDQTETSGGMYLSFQFSYANLSNTSDFRTIEVDFFKYIKFEDSVEQPEHIHVSAQGLGFSDGMIASGGSFLSDGNWHILEVRNYVTGEVSLLIDGIELISWTISSAFSGFKSPYVTCVLWGASDESNMYAVDSAWIKKI